MRTREEVLPICWGKPVSGVDVGGECDEAYQEDDRDVQQEGAQAVEEEGEQADAVDLGHGDLGDLPEEGNDKVHGGAHRGEVVQRDQGVHLKLGRAEEALDHGEAESLKDDAEKLVDEADPHELDLADRGDDHTDDDGRDVEEDLEVRLRHAEGPAGQEDGNGGGGLR